jgi:hypothetical protein
MTRTPKQADPYQQLKAFNRANDFAAQIILENPDRFGGPGSLAVIWAKLRITRQLNDKRLRREVAA